MSFRYKTAQGLKVEKSIVANTAKRHGNLQGTIVFTSEKHPCHPRLTFT